VLHLLHLLLLPCLLTPMLPLCLALWALLLLLLLLAVLRALRHAVLLPALLVTIGVLSGRHVWVHAAPGSGCDACCIAC
jgi:hypothetical protein